MDLENDFTLSPTESLHENDATSLLSEKDLDLDTTDFQTERAKNFAKEQAKEPAKNSGFIANLDICFMLDCTSSMMSYIQLARDKIKEVIEEVKEQNPGSEIYIAIVGYRDISDTPRFEVLPFTCDIKEAKAFLDKLQALGGGDLPEDVNGGFQQALQLEWRSDAKMILHIADAPCHGKGFHHFGCGDAYPDGYKEDADWEAIFEQIVAYRIDYLFLNIIPTNTDLMFEKFKEMGERFGALEHGVLFKQEPISLVDAMANHGVAYPALSKVALFSVAMPVFEKRKRGRPRKNAAKEDAKEKPTTRGRKKKEESVKRDRSTSKDREREEERAKSSTAWGKLGVPGLPPGMTALEEQEYFAKLLSKEMTATIHRKRDAKK